MKLTPDAGQIDGRFLFHYFRSPRSLEQISARALTTGVPHINLGILKAFPVAVPPLGEQRRIAEVLDRAEALRVKRRSALAQLETLAKAIFLDLFGDPVANSKEWKRVPFGELLAKIDSGWSPICLARPVEGDEWGVLKLGAVTWCEYDASENKALPLDVEPDPDLEVMPGDLLFARKNTHDLVAACALVTSTPPRLMMSDLIFRFRLRSDANVDSCFLHQLLIYPTKRRDIQKLAGGTAGSMPNISKARLQTVPIEVPPLALQQDFARRIAAVEKLKAAHRASLAELDALFAALQHRAFRGEL
jgi:type I restriction enzyme S subunit